MIGMTISHHNRREMLRDKGSTGAFYGSILVQNGGSCAAAVAHFNIYATGAVRIRSLFSGTCPPKL